VNAGRRKTRRILVLLAAVAACAPIPTINFVVDGDGGTSPDATTTSHDDAGGTNGGDGGGAQDTAAPPPPDSGSDAASDDAATFDDGGNDDATDQPSDDAGDAAPTIKCGTTLVNTCADCAGLPLLCKKAGRNDCVSDCTQCASNFLPCLHCATPDAAPHGTCVQINGSGQIACARTNLCGCAVDTDCMPVDGSAQTCDLQGAKRVGCLTCGGPTTGGLACVSASGVQGTCQLADATAPVCAP
jgi:hypothetical protein